MLTGLLVLLAVLVAATAFGLVRRARDGRLRSVAAGRGARGPVSGQLGPAGERLTADDVGAPFGERATLVQFSSAFCAPCRATRTLLTDVVRGLDGVAHVEVDAEHHLELVRRLDVRRTPTTLVLDASGAVVNRAVGLPRRAEVVAVVGALTGSTPAEPPA